MTDADLQLLAKGMAPAVKAAIDMATAPLLARIAVLEQRALVPGPAGRDGERGPVGERGEKGVGEAGPAGPAGPKGDIGLPGLLGNPGSKGESGERGEPGQPGAIGPAGEKGDPGREGPLGPIGPAGALGQPGQDGPMGPMGLAGVGERGERGEKGDPGREGIGFTGALIDRDGNLALTLSDGSVKTLGRVVGRDVDVADVHRAITDELSKWPKPKDGKDGLDGLGFDDWDVVPDGERSFSFVFRQGERVKTFGPFKTATVLHRGVHQAGQAYSKGDQVSWNGSTWIAMMDTSARPGGPAEADRAWILSSKNGSPGKQGPEGPKGKDGLNGKDGRDGRYS